MIDPTDYTGITIAIIIIALYMWKGVPHNARHNWWDKWQEYSKQRKDRW